MDPITKPSEAFPPAMNEARDFTEWWSKQTVPTNAADHTAKAVEEAQYERMCRAAWDAAIASRNVAQLDDSTFDRMADELQALESMTDEELRLLLVNAGLPPAANKLYAVMSNMRRVFGTEQVTRWLKRCGELGILT